jgi:hypothetical protein
MKKNISLHNQNKKLPIKKVLNVKRFVLIFKIFILGLLMVLISVGCAYIEESVSVSKDKVMVGEQVELSVVIEKGDSFGCGHTIPKKMPGSAYGWIVEPSDGATVKGGVFVASKPGKYTVTPVIGTKAETHTPKTITVEGTAAETFTTETTTTETTLPSIIMFSDGVVSDPINSSEADFFAKLTLEQGVVDSSGGYYLGGEQSVEGCTGTMSGIYDPKTRQFTGKYWDQVSIPTIDRPDEEYIMNGTFSEVIDHTGKVKIRVEGTQYHKKLNYAEDENGIWLYKDHIEWSETINSSREVTFTVIGLD